jgi:glucokinase
MDEKWVIAVDLGATHVSAGLVSQSGEIRDQREIMTRESADQPPLRIRLIKLCAELLAVAAERGLKPAGIAVGVPGIVDTDKGVLVAAGNLPELFGLPLGPELMEEFGLPTRIENDVNAQAVGELVFGVARGVKDFVLFSIGTDLGGGIVIDGKLHRGAHMIAAEFGHMTLDPDGAPCVCGGCGCVREYVSGAGIADKARAKLTERSRVLESVHGDRDRITARHLFQAADQGDPEALSLVEEFAKRFGAGIADVMKVLDPELVVLAGEICRSEPQLINRIIHWTRHFYFPLPQLPGFRVSELTKETAVLGPAAAFFVFHGIPAGPEHGPRHRPQG